MMTRRSLNIVAALVCCLSASLPVFARETAIQAGLAADLGKTGSAAAWSLGAASERKTEGMLLPSLAGLDSVADGVSNGSWRLDGGRLIAIPSAAQHAVATYTIPEGGAGFYSLRDSSILRSAKTPGDVELRVFVHRDRVDDAAQPEPAVYTVVRGGEAFDFDGFLGYLDKRDKIVVSIGPHGDASGDETELDFNLAQVPAIPVSNAVGEGWQFAGGTARVAVDEAAEGSYLVPHSGYYALHDASVALASGTGEAKVYVGHEPSPRKTISLGQTASRLNLDLGYLPKGERIHIAFKADVPTNIDFKAHVVEWAPRRAPLRVKRGQDGYLDVIAPDAPAKPIDVPGGRWIELAPTTGDSTEAIRAAFAKAKSLASNGWAGVRLQRGATYAIGGGMNGGNVFEFKDISRVILDGNGATLQVDSAEIQRRGYNLFTTGSGASDLVFADLTVASTYFPFTIGRIIDVNPKRGNTQKVTVELDNDAPDPINELVANGRTSAYVYDPNIPGRLGFGTWSHYPGSGEGAQLVPTDKPGIFTHSLTRTGSSLNVGDKWLVKNKGAGMTYLVTRGNSNNITLSSINGRASGGGALRFWSTSGVNILNCRFEPDGNNWISSSADGIHGRGREGVWIEDTILRGVCEDIMNTYGRTMAVKPDENPDDGIISLGVYESGSRSGNPLRNVEADDVRVGDRLEFFSPQTGKVLGYAHVRARDGEKVTLSHPVQGVVPWNNNPRDLTMVYSVDSVGNFVVRDSKFMDSMRIGIYIKAQGGVLFGNTIEGQSAPAVFAANEPEWPEGPPPTNLWIQGNTFSENNYGYMSRHRDFLVVDPADISIYTRKFRNPSEPDTHEAFIAHGEHANNHVKIIGNAFHDWRGMGVSVRNAKNVLIRDNLFLPPVEDETLRTTLKDDPSLSAGGIGRYAAIFLDSVSGVRVSGNRFVGIPEGDRTIQKGGDVQQSLDGDNVSPSNDPRGLEVAISFDEWFGNTSQERSSIGARKDEIVLQGATHAAGRLGAGLQFDGKSGHALLKRVASNGALTAQSTAFWFKAESGNGGGTQVLFAQEDAQAGNVIAIDNGELLAGVWRNETGVWLSLGRVVPETWRHVALVVDGETLRGFVDGVEVASQSHEIVSKVGIINTDASLGAAMSSVRLSDSRTIAPAESRFCGRIDEFRSYGRAITSDDAAVLALRRPMPKSVNN